MIRGCHFPEELVLQKRGQRMGWRVNRGTVSVKGSRRAWQS